jgi:hypothetical protein
MILFAFQELDLKSVWLSITGTISMVVICECFKYTRSWGWKALDGGKLVCSL